MHRHWKCPLTGANRETRHRLAQVPPHRQPRQHHNTRRAVSLVFLYEWLESALNNSHTRWESHSQIEYSRHKRSNCGREDSTLLLTYDDSLFFYHADLGSGSSKSRIQSRRQNDWSCTPLACLLASRNPNLPKRNRRETQGGTKKYL